MNQLTRRKIILYLAAIFVAGGISGAVITWGPARQARFKPRTMGKMCDDMRKQLQSRLHLSPEQVRKIEPILEQTAKEIEAVHQRTIEEIEEVLQKSNQEIAKQLNADQQAELNKLEQERRDFYRKRFKGRPPPQ